MYGNFYNAKVKHYADGSTKTVVCDSPIFRSPQNSYTDCLRFACSTFNFRNDFTNLSAFKIYRKASKIKGFYNIDPIYLTDLQINYAKDVLFPVKKRIKSNVVCSSSVRRAKDSIFDYVLNNNFNYFFTGTIDPKQYNSKDPKAIFSFVQNWLKDRVKRDNLSYIIISEYHKNGGIHFHGLLNCNPVSLGFVDSGNKLYKGHKESMKDFTAVRKGLNPLNGRIIYNLTKWKFGFTTCIELAGDKLHTAKYITKYITKDCKKIFGKFFWHSRDLKKPDITFENIDYDSIDSKEYFNDYVGKLKYFFRTGEENRRIEQEKKKALKKRSIFEEAKQLFYDIVNNLVVNLNTGEVLDFETVLE